MGNVTDRAKGPVDGGPAQAQNRGGDEAPAFEYSTARRRNFVEGRHVEQNRSDSGPGPLAPAPCRRRRYGAWTLGAPDHPVVERVGIVVA